VVVLVVSENPLHSVACCTSPLSNRVAYRCATLLAAAAPSVCDARRTRNRLNRHPIALWMRSDHPPFAFSLHSICLLITLQLLSGRLLVVS